MRLVTYLPPDAPHDGPSFRLAEHGRVGGLVERPEATFIVDLERSAALVRRSLPPTMLGLIEAGPEAWELARELLDEATRTGGISQRPLGDGDRSIMADLIRLLAPLPNPPMVRDFYAYEDHVRRGFAKRGEDIPAEWFQFPAFYKQNHRAILGPEDELPWPGFTDELDYELELAAIIGVGGADISEASAGDHIFGFTILNDVSARDLQRLEMKVRLGPSKSKDFASVLGPVIVTPDEIDPLALRPMARINGETVTDSRTADMRWTFEQMIAYCSVAEDLFPGDVFGSGTVSNGCGLEHGRMLAPGDELVLEVPGIGTLRNTVGQKQPKVRLPTPRDPSATAPNPRSGD